MIGHAGHPEDHWHDGAAAAEGRRPFARDGGAHAEACGGARRCRDPERLAYRDANHAFSIDDTAGVVAALQERFPRRLSGPHKEDICYATTNRQEAVKVIGEGTGLVLVIGAETSSNSKRLVEVALRAGAERAELVASADDIDWSWFEGVTLMGLTAGASAPEDLVQGVITACRARFDVTVQNIETARETVTFKLPRVLTA